MCQAGGGAREGRRRGAQGGRQQGARARKPTLTINTAPQRSPTRIGKHSNGRCALDAAQTQDA
eukprot:6740504-Alexandrium_andersonii.AAC.1